MNPKSQYALQQAAKLFRQQRLHEAEAICRRLIEAEPAALDAINLLSLISKQTGNLAQAEMLMRRCLDIDPRRADIHANMGNLLVQAGQIDNAVESYRFALRIDAGFRSARLGLAKALLMIAQASASAAEANILIGENTRDAGAWNILGSALRGQGMHTEAEAAFHEALSIRPDYHAARHNLGALLASLSRSEEALAELNRAYSGGIRGAEIAHNQASALMALGQFEDAEAVLVDTLREVPTATAIHGLLARIRYMRGNAGFASEFKRAVAAHPKHIDLRVGYSRIQRGAGDIAESVATLAEGLKSIGQHAHLLAEMSTALHEAGRFEEALRVGIDAVAADPANPIFEIPLIPALLSLGQASEALRLIEKARQREPLNQLYIAFEATALRLQHKPRYKYLYDYDRLVQQYQLAVPEGWSSIEDFNAELATVLKDRHKFSAPPLDQSLRAGTQTARGLLGDSSPVIQAFLKAIEPLITEYRVTIGSDADHPLSARNCGTAKLIGCWSVRLHREGYHVNHVHTEGWVSSAYYVEVPAEVEDIDARSGWIKFGEPRFPVPSAIAERFVQPKAGSLLLFPSYMWHGTMPIHSDHARMTIAFDVVPNPAVE